MKKNAAEFSRGKQDSAVLGPPDRGPPDLGQFDRYRAIFELSADAILIIEGNTFVDCNQATVEMLRYAEKGELLATHPSELSPERQPDGQRSFEKANEMMTLAFERGSHRFEWDHRRADGEVFPVEVLLTAVPGEERPTLHVVWRDITERKRLEGDLRHAQKLEAIGKLAGGVAHDFNNLLVAIIGHSDLLQERLEHEPELLEHVEQIRNAGEHAAALTRQLLAFGRKQALQPEVLDLNNVVDELSRLLDRLLGERIRLVASLAARPMVVKVDPDQLRQVLLNLCSNARDAMRDEGGTLTLETRRVERRFPVAIGLHEELAPGHYVQLIVEDTGTGMDAETLARAFDPFFTTKVPGEGTGLGLATVYGIVKQSGGAVSLTSKVGRGTRVEILLPLDRGAPRPRRASRPQERARGGSEVVLVVEDDLRVADLVRRALRKGGYDVLYALDAEQALMLLEERGTPPDVLLADVLMPGMNGSELAERVVARFPTVRVLLMSGYTNEQLARAGAPGTHAALLQKPFSAEGLLSRVRSLLDEV